MKSHLNAESAVYLSHLITLASIDKHDSNGKLRYKMALTKLGTKTAERLQTTTLLLIK
jgi:hypothetical protein|tara:strand:- start:27721 stop:27894 length:174 start_codon:yes stop_codon:yes gene_type:complete